MRWLLALPWERGLIAAGGFAVMVAVAVLALAIKLRADPRPWLAAKDVRPTVLGGAACVLLIFLGGVLVGWAD